MNYFIQKYQVVIMSYQLKIILSTLLAVLAVATRWFKLMTSNLRTPIMNCVQLYSLVLYNLNCVTGCTLLTFLTDPDSQVRQRVCFVFWLRFSFSNVIAV